MDLSAIAPITVLARLGLSFLVGALIGLERERHRRPAGLRTHILVTLASALFTMLSIVAAGEHNDPGRIAAQIVTGIGFLGAGTIMRYGSTIRGLTTAATLWLAAALGMAVGFGWVLPALAAAVIAFLVLVGVRYLESWMASPLDHVDVTLTAQPGTNPLPAVMGAVESLGGELKNIQMGSESVSEGLHLTLMISLPGTCDASVLGQVLRGLEGVMDVDIRL